MSDSPTNRKLQINTSGDTSTSEAKDLPKATQPDVTQPQTPVTKGGEFVAFLKQLRQKEAESPKTPQSPVTPLSRGLDRAQIVVDEAKIRPQIGRIVNDFPWEIPATEPNKVLYAGSNTNMQHCVAMVVEMMTQALARESKDDPFPLRTGIIKISDDKKLEDNFRVIDPQIKIAIEQLMDFLIGEACRQILDAEGNIKPDILAIFNLTELAKKYPDEVKLALIDSYIGNIMLGNLIILVNQEMKKDIEKQQARYDSALSAILESARELNYGKFFAENSIGMDFTDKFQAVVLRRNVNNARKKPTECFARVINKFQQPSTLTVDVFVSFLKDTYPLEGIPDKFKNTVFAAVTREDKARLIASIMRDEFAASQPNDFENYYIEGAIRKRMEQAVKEAQTTEAEFKLLKIEMRKLFPQYEKAQDQKTQDSKAQDETTMSAVKDEIEKRKRVMDAFDAGFRQKTPKQFATVLPHNRPLSVAYIKNLPASTQSTMEFVAILLTEQKAIKEGPLAAALANCVDTLKKEYPEEVKGIEAESANSINYVFALKLLELADKTKEPMEMYAARSLAHNLIRYSFIHESAQLEEARATVVKAAQDIHKKLTEGSFGKLKAKLALPTLLTEISKEFSTKPGSAKVLGAKVV